MRKAVAVCILLAFGASIARAQEGAPSRLSVREAALQTLRPDLRGRAVAEDTVTSIRTRPARDGRVDLHTGVYRARYRIRDRVPAGLPPEAAAREHLRRLGPSYGIESDPDELIVEHVRGGRFAHHVRLRQMLAGVPVYRRDVSVNLDKSGQPTMVVNGYVSHLDQVTSFDAVPQISGTQAVRIAQTAGLRGLSTSGPELVVYPSKPPRLAWTVTAASDDHAVAWEVLVDARTGEIIHMLDVSLHGHAVEIEVSAQAGRGLHEASGGTTPNAVDGTGYVFDPDPLTSADVPYGGEYVDGDDADTPALNDQRFLVTLRGITQGEDGLYRLSGPYVHIQGDAEAVPAEPSPNAFTYTRADDRFEAVNVYYHIDKSQRYVQSLGFTESELFPIKNEPVNVDPRAFPRDDSNFDRVNLIRFGTGGIDDAEDADVVWHEYAHALLNFTRPGLTGHFEGNALHEGWSDYWAASYSRYLSEEDPQIPEHNWRRLYTWDGNMPCWPGRTLDHDGRYPDDMSYEAPGCQIIYDYYQWGLLWATTLMDIYPQVGRRVLDRLNLASHAYLGTSSNFADAAEALIQADFDLYGGRYSSILVQELGEAGYVDPSQFGPILDHEPVKATEQTGGTVRIEAAASATTSPVDSVFVVFAVDDGSFQHLMLEPTTDNRFAGELPVPKEAATVRYYVEAVDEQGRRRRLPTSAPTETYAFDVGPDHVPPVIRHDAPGRASLIAWPVTLYAEVEDNLGVDSVWVEYEIRGGAHSAGSFAFETAAEAYRGRFPEPSQPVEEGDVVEYRIVAQDASEAGNEAAAPAEGTFSFELVRSGVLQAFDFEGINEGLIATGSWSVGRPTFGLRSAHSGERVWATVPGGAYPDTTSRSTLTLPPLDLQGLGPAYLIFWHWYDFEHGGLAEPGVFDELADIWDGGNVKVSVDGGETWSTIEPRGGYNGRIADEYGNPLGGQPAFGGYSYGWRREIVELPDAGDVRLRFDFATDVGNGEDALYFAGWYVDDIAIATELPADGEPPSAEGLPPDRVVRLPGQDEPPSVSIMAVDDTGLEAVLSRYEITDRDGTRTGAVRLAMSGTDASVYEGFIVPPATFSPGDRIDYELLLRDFDGNETVYGAPFVVDFRAEQRTSVLGNAVATGAWRRFGRQWIASDAADVERSSLVLQPFTVSSNGETNEVILEHAYHLEPGMGGNVKISTDDGSSWTVLMPEEPYPATLSGADDHPMAGEAVFSGTSEGLSEIVFDLGAHAGRSVRLRIDLASPRALEVEETWIIGDISYRSTTADEEFTTERAFALHANFPDPVVDRTTISYTIAGEESVPVRLSVFDVLGRRVSVLRHARHEPGSYTVQVEARDLASGVYILYLETPHGTRSERMVVVH